MFTISQTGLKGSFAFGTSKPTTRRLTRNVPRRGSVAVCSHQNEALYTRVMRTVAGAAAAVLIFVSMPSALTVLLLAHKRR